MYDTLEEKWGTGAGAHMISLMWTIPKGFREGIDPFTKEKYTYNCLEYIDWLHRELDGKFHNLRIGLDLCGTYIINNRKIGKILDDLNEMGKEKDFGFYMDCQCPPCINEPDEPRPWHSNQIGEVGCPADQGEESILKLNQTCLLFIAFSHKVILVCHMLSKIFLSLNLVEVLNLHSCKKNTDGVILKLTER